MKYEIENFITKLNKTKCCESIEFRLHFQKKWLSFQKEECDSIKKELVYLMNNYKSKYF